MCPQLICIIGFGRLEARHDLQSKRNFRGVLEMVNTHKKPVGTSKERPRPEQN